MPNTFATKIRLIFSHPVGVTKSDEVQNMQQIVKNNHIKFDSLTKTNNKVTQLKHFSKPYLGTDVT